MNVADAVPDGIQVTSSDDIPVWVQIPEWVIIAASGGAVRLYGAYRAHVNHGRADNHVWPTQESLAAALGYSRGDKLSKYRRELEDLGAIRVTEIRSADGMRRRCLVDVRMRPPAGYTGHTSFQAARGSAKAVNSSVSAGQPGGPQTGFSQDHQTGGLEDPRMGFVTRPTSTTPTEPDSDVAPSARSAADARRATDRSSAREAASGSAASDGAEAPKTSRSRKASSERLSRREAEAIRMVEAALPRVLVELLPKYRPPVLRDAVLEALESRTPGQLAARVERRWHAHGYADAHHSADGKGIGSPVGVAVALVRPSVDCPDPMCEDGTTVDTGQPCRVCEERRAGRKGRRGQGAAETPVGGAVAAWWECSDCRGPVRGEKPSDGAVCRDCQAAGDVIRAVLSGPMPDDQECHPQAMSAA